jgi:ABC-type nitrate/sulfonate/bicarbonate transport system substrate-binding protein
MAPGELIVFHAGDEHEVVAGEIGLNHSSDIDDGRLAIRRRAEMRMTVRRTVICLLFFSSMLLPNLTSAQDKVRIGVTNPNMVFLNARIALVKGFLQEEGIQAEVIRMSPSVMITAASTGNIDYPLVFGSVVRAAIRGMPLRITSNFMTGPMHVLVARSEFQTVHDLRGKTVGIDSHGATGEVTGRMIYKHFGMDIEKDSKLIALGSAAGIENERLKVAAEEMKKGLGRTGYFNLSYRCKTNP